MKILKSENTNTLESMTLGKIRLVVNGEDPENIWVKIDKDKCYLQNHALAFYPFPSWGLELPYKPTVDVAEIRGKTPNDTVMTLHPEAYESINNKKLIGEDGTVDVDELFRQQNLKTEEEV